MNFWKFLADQWLLFIGWLLFIVLTVFVMWLSPSLFVDWSLVGYLVLIEGVLLLSFLGVYYLIRQAWWRKFDLQDKQLDVLQEQISGARSYEERLLQAYVNQVLTEHQRTTQSILQNQQDQKDYIDSWVHEIKVPLAAADLLLQNVEDDIPDEKYRLLENELSLVDDYVEQVLYYARLDSFSRDYLIQECWLKDVFQPVVRSQANHFIQKKLQLEIIGEDHQVLTDAKWLRYIFRQLLNNAVKYTPDTGRIQIELSSDQAGVALKIKDSGIGIPKEDLARIFDKGFTGENGRKMAQHSTGLGLYLAYNLAEKLNIRLTAESSEGKGTVMTLHFPKLTYYQDER